MRVPFLDLARLHASIDNELRAAFSDIVDRSAFVGGKASANFEHHFSAVHGAAAAAGCGSGTDALALALRALGVGPGDEVIVPSMTFVATAEAVVHVGATPVIVDVDPTTLLLADAVELAITPRTKAVIPVHLYGHVVPFGQLQAWRDRGLLVVEDAAQAHLASDGGRPVGTVGHAACFSFYPGKNLGALGDGGAVISNDPDVIATVMELRDHGRRSKYEHDVIGWCSRLDGLQAAFLDVKLRHLATWTEGRRNAASRYRERLGDRVVPWQDGAVHHLLVVRVAADHRNDVAARLEARGVATGVHYPVPLSQQPSCEPYTTACPASEAAATEVLSLPMDPLMTADEVDYVCDALEDALTA
ncbi:MAG TPA: DegT/DnrJ/EryC1/StrS family aminotransferase [Acidimicrobiales bacterium]|nr:DegT/DnrJ/EryC1/StrS family aminotransferase [Acidimicrobiales bacterium]